MKALFVTKNGHWYMELEDVKKMAIDFTEDYTELRSKGVIGVHRQELDNQPIVKGFVGPMWDGNGLRYETQEVYNSMTI